MPVPCSRSCFGTGCVFPLGAGLWPLLLLAAWPLFFPRLLLFLRFARVLVPSVVLCLPCRGSWWSPLPPALFCLAGLPVSSLVRSPLPSSPVFFLSSGCVRVWLPCRRPPCRPSVPLPRFALFCPFPLFALFLCWPGFRSVSAALTALFLWGCGRFAWFVPSPALLALRDALVLVLGAPVRFLCFFRCAVWRFRAARWPVWRLGLRWGCWVGRSSWPLPCLHAGFCRGLSSLWPAPLPHRARSCSGRAGPVALVCCARLVPFCCFCACALRPFPPFEPLSSRLLALLSALLWGFRLAVSPLAWLRRSRLVLAVPLWRVSLPSFSPFCSRCPVVLSGRAGLSAASLEMRNLSKAYAIRDCKKIYRIGLTDMPLCCPHGAGAVAPGRWPL